MKARMALGTVAGALLLLMSMAHAFLGWPALRAALQASGVDPEVVGALAAGWYFGSTSMLVFGCIVLLQALQITRRAAASTAPSRAIAYGLLLFGLIAFLSREFNPHFLIFVVSGLLVGLFSFGRR